MTFYFTFLYTRWDENPCRILDLLYLASKKIQTIAKIIYTFEKEKMQPFRNNQTVRTFLYNFITFLIKNFIGLN